MSEENNKKTSTTTTGTGDTVNVNVQVVQPGKDKVLVVGTMKTKAPKLLANDKSRAKERKSRNAARKVAPIKKAEPTAQRVTDKMQDRG